MTKEISTLAKITKLLDALDTEARDRVLAYLADKYADRDPPFAAPCQTEGA